MSKAEHLSKEEELYRGSLIQSMIKAKEEIESGKLNKAEIREREKRIIKGEEAVTQLVESNTGLVYNIARNFKSKYPSAPPLEDLFQEGMAGLVTAIMRYDPTRGNKLSTVATYWIFQGITRWTNKTGRLVKLPENRVTDYTNITKLRNKYAAEGISKTEIDEIIMKELDLSTDDMFFINGAAAIPTSLNRTVDDDSDKELLEIVLDDTADSAESLFLADATFQILVDRLNELDEIQKDVVLSQFSFDNVPGTIPMTPRQVKAKYDLSTSRYKRILTLALADINKDMKELDLSFEDFISVD